MTNVSLLLINHNEPQHKIQNELTQYSPNVKISKIRAVLTKTDPVLSRLEADSKQIRIEIMSPSEAGDIISVI